jgi:hypothetical protein
MSTAIAIVGYPLLIVVGVPVSLLLAKREAARDADRNRNQKNDGE